MKKKIVFPLTLLLVLLMNIATFAAVRYPLGEGETRPRWERLDEDSLPIKNEWFQYDDGEWIYLDEEGYTLQSTWFQDTDGRWYYFDKYCYLLTDAITPDGYYVGADGAWVDDSAQRSLPDWMGTYIAADEQVITVTAVDANGVTLSFKGYSEDGWYTWDYQLTYTNAEKTQAVHDDKNTMGEILGRTVYTLTETGIEVTVEPSGGWQMGSYIKQ